MLESCTLQGYILARLLSSRISRCTSRSLPRCELTLRACPEIRHCLLLPLVRESGRAEQALGALESLQPQSQCYPHSSNRLLRFSGSCDHPSTHQRSKSSGDRRFSKKDSKGVRSACGSSKWKYVSLILAGRPLEPAPMDLDHQLQ